MARPSANVDLEFSARAMGRSLPPGFRPSWLIHAATCSIANRKSAIQKLIHPSAVLRSEDWQFFHHELGLADRANHVCPSRGVPFLRHALAGVAAPALDVSTAREGTAIDLFQIVFVQPGFTSAIDVVAVIEHETSAVRMPEKFEIDDLHLVPRLSIVDIIDDLVSGTKPNQIDIKFVANRTNQADQILVLLLCAVHVTLLVNKPRDLRIRPDLLTQLFGAQTRRPHKVRPPMIVRNSLVFFPLIHRWPTNQEYVFTPGRRRGLQTERDHRQTACE